ncbi:MAG: DUF4249 domain-containing protein [Mangrovibacterium sp.]
MKLTTKLSVLVFFLCRFAGVLMLALLFAGCEKEIEYTGDSVKPIMVLNSVIMEGEEITCNLSRSTSIFFDPSEQEEGNDLYNSDRSFRNGVQLELYCDGELIGEPEWTGNDYRWSVVAEEGKEYHIRGHHDDYGAVEATTKVLAKPEIVDVQMQANSVQSQTNFSITLNDEPGRNYYQLKASCRMICIVYSDYEVTLVDTTEYSFYIYPNDAILNYNQAITDGDGLAADNAPNLFMIFDDALFDGTSQEIKFYSSGLFENDMYFSYQFLFELRQISRELYLYYKSIDYYDYYGVSPFSEPVMIYSNVEGGAGILGSCNSAHYELVQ